MKSTHLIITGSALLAVALVGCGGSSEGGMGGAAPLPAPTGQNLDTAEVLVLARATSETSDPLVINDGAVTISGSSEATSAVEVNTP